MIKANKNKVLSDIDKNNMIDKLEIEFDKILRIMQFDVANDQQIKDTPRRIAKMWVNETFSGCYTEEPNITIFENTKKYDEMVFLGPIDLHSVCSHHFKDFIGSAYVAYIPNKSVVGISKLARIVKWFMKRPQIQEELSEQIADYIMQKLKPKGCAVYICAQHLCMKTRGVEEPNSFMKTSVLRGCFRKAEVRQEFLGMINK